MDNGDTLYEVIDLTQVRLELKLDIGPRYGEPSDYLTHYEGTVFSGESLDLPVGRLSVYIAELVEAYHDGEDPWEVLDSLNAGVAHFCELISLHTRRFKPTVARLVGSDIERLLIIDHLCIDAPYRGHDLGLNAIDTVCAHLADEAVVVLLAFPTQWTGRVDENPKAFFADQMKLKSYYARSSFVSILSAGSMLRPWLRNSY
ncbi:hypothetical protein [Pseudomonas syringae]|uniref:ATPase component n=1 Tax=Pseudomonas syringae pv. actinidiae TaxID=103796 RepID=A0A2V0QIC2_PSESF|nr:hypothetical protein [Pseudomonas syringae]EPM90716.1 hypothetical protein A259_40002 [Pseudomonas syringae pv. actinidiae ICMP 19070]AQL37552.1 hypothetical protein JN853_14555 [Pseudomonas syringae pv. actinidiae ICMP 9853]EGH63776.1 hypothetical protein PSYAC_02482 [Pseudomonas syringae pv. actinidiae str. M302091]EPM53468.1 hypothetical protein A256_11560 [Pseudomonas syringae pv. actinidiae ICMP 19103]EPM87923.1 hypothetical protein A260_11237 [Pseudomonas syringae pv. actinidiae ICMP 